MIIFGWGRGRPKDRGAVVPSRCPQCGNEDYFRHVSSTRWLSLFFIPLIPYSTKHFLLCPVCTQGRPLTREQAARAEEMTAWTERYRTHEISGEEYKSRVADFLAYLRPIDAGPAAGGPGAIGAPPTALSSGTPAPATPATPAAGSTGSTGSTPAPAPMHECAACRCPLPDHAHFCPNCGRRTAA